MGVHSAGVAGIWIWGAASAALAACGLGYLLWSLKGVAGRTEGSRWRAAAALALGPGLWWWCGHTRAMPYALREILAAAGIIAALFLSSGCAPALDRLLDPRRAGAGPRGAAAAFFREAAAACAAMAALLAILWLCGVWRPYPAPLDMKVVKDFTVWAGMAGIAEELLFRAILLRALAALLGLQAGLALSALAFGWLHMHGGIPGQAGATLGGLLLGVIYLRGSIFAAMGCHAAWNLAQVLAGLGPAGSSPLHAEMTGPMWLTGTPEQVEGGIPAIIVLLAALVLASKGLKGAAEPGGGIK